MLDWAPSIGRYLAPGPDRAAAEAFPILADNAKTPGADVLRRLIAQGAAAGLAGVIYENRDRGHSRLDARLFPQVTPVRYTGTLHEGRADYGMAGPVLFRAPVIGNSSTAVKHGNMPRSLTRLAMTTPGAPERAFQGYAANHLYIYPEHRDHDRVDLYPANWPYTVQSQGSSYTDRPFYEALLLTLAAFTPETRARLEAEGLIAPTLQMILRRTQAGVQTRAAYLSALAHPMAFDSKALRPGLMASLAASIAPGDLPPLVALQVEVENFRPRAGLADLSERLFDTPSAIARVWRGWEGEKEMIVSAAQTRDPNGRDLSFDWVLLHGDPERVQITPLDATGTRARISVQWHARRPVLPRADRLIDRVDIGVFANNGVHDSAPAFVSVSFPTHEARTFDTDPDGRPRLISVDYDAAAREARYDPALHWSAPWRDEMTHDDRGRVTGWTRHFPDGTTQVFDSRVTGTGHEVSRAHGTPPVLTMMNPDTN